MSYLADGLNGGFQAGFSAVTQKKRDKKQDEKDAARLKLEQERMASDIKERGLDRNWRSGESEKDRTFQGTQASLGREFQGTQASLDRNFRTSERVGGETFQDMQAGKTREFQGTQAGLDRTQRQSITDQQLLADADARKMANDLAERKFKYDADPANPQNEYSRAAAGAMRTKAGNFGDLGTEDPAAAPAKPAALSPKDEAAVASARARLAANPNDARARAILTANGLGQ